MCLYASYSDLTQQTDQSTGILATFIMLARIETCMFLS